MPGTRRVAPGHLLIEVTSFVGRRHELGEIKKLLAETRMVTLTGVGGTGKTRLALRVAAELSRTFRDGVWFVDLSQLPEPALLGEHQAQDPDLLAYLVMAALKLPQGDGPPLQQLVDFLADREVLLLLDNCEHVLPASAWVTDSLLRACPWLRVLTTSREPLAIPGEALYPVPSLPTPDVDGSLSLADVMRYESVALFEARARSVVPDFSVTDENREVVARICRQLDGLPLSIELAAARVRVLTPRQILDRLTDRFALLSRGSRTAPARQQTLRACVEWSFDLCTKPERLLWQRLSVFPGEFELDAVEGVCTDDDVPVDEVVDLLADLVDKSILTAADSGGVARYRMLETLRDFGERQLLDEGEHITLRRRHRDWYEHLVGQASAEWVTERQGYWYARLAREHPNLRAAVEFCLTEPGEVAGALSITMAPPAIYWWSRGISGEGLLWMERALAEATEPTVLRARALAYAGHLALWHRDPATVGRLANEARVLAERLGDFFGVGFAAFVMALAVLSGGDLDAVVAPLEAALAMASVLPESPSALSLKLQVMLALAGVTVAIRDDDRAQRYYGQVVEITEPQGEGVWRAYALMGLAVVAWRRDDRAGATRDAQEGLRLAQAYGSDDRYAALCMEVLAWVAGRSQHHRKSAVLLGAAHRLLTQRGTRATDFRTFAADHEECERRLRDAMGVGAFTQAFQDGCGLPFPDAVAYALDERRQPSPSTSGRVGVDLTPREREIAELIGRGMTNKEIADALVISRRTAETHVEHLLTKLGFSSRAQVAAWVNVEGADRPAGEVR